MQRPIMNEVNLTKLHALRCASSLAAVSLSLVLTGTAYAAADICVSPQREPSTSSSKSSSRVPTDPNQRAIYDADALRRDGREEEAIALYRKVFNAPSDRRQSRRRAALRLAQYEIRQDNFDAAQEFVAVATAPGATSSITSQAEYLEQVIAYEREETQAQNRLETVDAMRRAGAPKDQLISGYEAILSLECPYPDNLKFRAQMRIADVYASEGEFIVARQALDEAQEQIPAGLIASPRGQEYLAAIAQRRVDLAAEENLFAADKLGDDDYAAAVRLHKEVLASSPAPSDKVLTRARYSLVSLYAASGDFDEARAMIDSIAASTASDDESSRTYLMEKAIDLNARERIAQASALRETDRPAERQLLTSILSMAPPPSQSTIYRVHYKLSDSYAKDRMFDKAQAELDIVRELLASSEGRSTERLELAEDRLAQREIDMAVRDRLSDLREVRGESPRRAISSYHELIEQNPAPSPQITDRVRLELADTLSREGYYGDARTTIAAVEADPSSDAVRDRAAELGQRLDEDAPQQSLHGRVGLALFYDSNAPSIVSELRTEQNDTGFPLDQRFDDGVAVITSSLTHRVRLDSSYNYWQTDVGALKTFQFDLTSLDRAVIDFATGPVFNLPDQRATAYIAGQYSRERRGGNFLRELYGVELGATKRLGEDLRAKVRLNISHNNDTRPDLDGMYYDLSGALTFSLPGRKSVTPEIRVQVRDIDDPRLDTKRYGARVTYAQRWGDDELQYGVTVAPQYQFIRYDNRDLSGRRQDQKIDGTAEVWMRIDQRYEFAIEYRYLKSTSNTAGRDRLANHRIGISTTFMF